MQINVNGPNWGAYLYGSLDINFKSPDVIVSGVRDLAQAVKDLGPILPVLQQVWLRSDLHDLN